MADIAVVPEHCPQILYNSRVERELGFLGQACACALLLTSSECSPLFLGRNFVTKCPDLAVTLKLKASWGKGEGDFFKCHHKIAHLTLVQKCWVQEQRRKISFSLKAKAKGNVGEMWPPQRELLLPFCSTQVIESE